MLYFVLNMRNLVGTNLTTVPSQAGQLSVLHQFCVDADKLCVWLAADNELCCIEENGTFMNMAPLSSHLASGDTVIAMEFVPDLESVCLALSSGDILMYNTMSCHLECVGGVDAGLAGMSWSPDQDVVILVTKDDKLVLMTMDFDSIVETTLHPEDFGESQPVTVGWGKKETQFHGSQGKPKPQAAQKPEVAPALSWDDGRTRVSWRGDGEYFVVSCIDSASGARRIRVYNRMCVLQATSDSCNGLGQCLHWRPSGNLIASSQMKPHRQDIVFFERNGLQHGEFPLQEGAWLVQEVCWNNDSSVLAVLLKNGDSDQQATHTTKVQLWTVGNYHWYLKQEIRVKRSKKTTPTGDLVGIMWDPIKPLRLHMLTTDGDYWCYNWRWCVDTSHTHSPQNSAPVAVIDGACILLTSFRFSVIPPPMASHKISMTTPVTSVSFAPPPMSNNFLALLADGSMAVFGCDEKAAVSKDTLGFRQLNECPKLVGMATVDVECVRCVTWWKPDKLLAVGRKEGQEVIVECDLSLGSEVNISVNYRVPSPSPVFSLCVNPNTGSAIAQLADGKGLLWIQSDGSSLNLEPASRVLPDGQTCEQIALAVFNGEERVVGLNEFSGALYVGGAKVTSGCTSFALHNEFLLLTTTAHVLRFISLTSEPQALPDISQSSLQDKSVRSLERGSKLVCVVPYDSRVVLQMPRGNLETIYPRALVLSSVRRALDRIDYKSAFIAMRKHRINLNLLHDHNPQVFMKRVGDFVEQLERVNFINLFLTELKEEDVTTTMYLRPAETSCEGDGVSDSCEGGGRNKVDSVCAAVRGALVSKGTNKYLLSIITTHVRETTPNLEAVLAILKDLKAHTDRSLADEAVKYALLLVDVNELYNIALGMYDFDLVLLVAEKSQKDPKEYLPFLNELRKLPVDYQRYKIDVYLQRYGRALEHICKCGSDKFSECLALIRTRSLYSQALAIYSDITSSEYKEIAASYGVHLRSNGKHREAGLMFAQCGDCEEALKSFEKSGDWRQVFPLSAQLQYSQPDTAALARRIANHLKSVKRHTEAAQVLLDYAGDVVEGVVTLLEGSCWEEALRLAHLHCQSNLVESHIRPSVMEAASSQLALFETMETTFVRHTSRLEVVRRLKREKEQAILEGTYVADERDVDLFSDTSSVTGRSSVSSLPSSVLSKASGRSSKNRRKAERKKHSLREGSAHEDVALMEALAEIVGTVDRLQDSVSSLLSMLVLFGLMDTGRALQTVFERLLGVVKMRVKEVWSPAVKLESKENITQGVIGPAATVNSIVAAMQSSSKEDTSSIGVSSSPQLRSNVNWKLDVFT